MCTRERIIAVDFDGCLCENAWPDIGEAKQDVIDALLSRQKQGAKIILWTCRVGERLDAAVRWCADRGIAFDAINRNLPSMITTYGNDCRKVYADEYWDDKAVNPEICNVSIPLQNEEPGPILYVFHNDSMAKEESEKRVAPMMEAKPNLTAKGTITIKHPWFSVTRAAFEHFTECVMHEKKARIVIDYDPQDDNTKITYYHPSLPEGE